MTAPAPAPTEPPEVAAFHARVAKRIRWAQHVASRGQLTPAARDAADQVADEIVRACLAQVGGQR